METYKDFFYNFWRAQLGIGEEMFCKVVIFIKYAHCPHSRTSATYDLFNLILNVGVNPHTFRYARPRLNCDLQPIRILELAKEIVGLLPFSIFANHTCTF